jgi:phosphopantothenoylcysteine decarboxylase / phosphopantothenate---cysteine ligase
MENYAENRLVIKAAAVSDFRPRDSAEQKVKKNEAGLLLELVPNHDILSELGAKKGNHILVGFAAETESAVENAHDKLIRKNLDLIIVNNLNEPGAGFAVPTNRVSIINRLGAVEELPLMAKADLAHLILDRVGELLVEKLD